MGCAISFFPPACIPRCRRAEHLCQYSFSGKRRGQGFALRADKGLGKCGFLDATCWHLSGKPGQCCFTSQPGIQEVGCREKVGEMNGKWRDVLILKGVAGQWVAEKRMPLFIRGILSWKGLYSGEGDFSCGINSWQHATATSPPDSGAAQYSH